MVFVLNILELHWCGRKHLYGTLNILQTNVNTFNVLRIILTGIFKNGIISVEYPDKALKHTSFSVIWNRYIDYSLSSPFWPIDDVGKSTI